MSQDLYKEKYIKYKSKYLSLKNEEGGIFNKMTPGRYIFLVPSSVFNMIAAYIFFNQLTNTTSTKGKTASKTPQTSQEQQQQPVVSIDSINSDIFLNIINNDNKPSYRISPGDNIYTNLKDNSTFYLFDHTRKRFGFDLEPESVSDKSTMEKMKKLISSKTKGEPTDKNMKEDIELLKKKIRDPKYKIINYEVNLKSANVIYSSEHSKTESIIHPLMKHINKIKSAIENVKVDDELQPQPQSQYTGVGVGVGVRTDQ